MRNLIGPLLIIFLAVPLAVLTATYLWNVVLTEAVTWANPVGPWQMFGLMLLYYILFPGTKATIKSKDGE